MGTLSGDLKIGGMVNWQVRHSTLWWRRRPTVAQLDLTLALAVLVLAIGLCIDGAFAARAAVGLALDISGVNFLPPP